MGEISIRSDEVANLLDEIVERTGESKVGAVKHALERRLAGLRARESADRTLVWLRTAVWPQVPDTVRGRTPTKEDQEDLLGYG